MQSYKDVCKNKDCVWFEINQNEGEKFLNWAKILGCVWLNGKEIEPQKDANFLHYSIRSDGKLANVPTFIWLAKDPKFENIERYVFCEYIKGKKVVPKSHMYLIIVIEKATLFGFK